ncbi:MAG: transporter substrate-binding domain-containing protein [Sneathiella sp.]|nr:transporter substrate-binding domain-containing protein [Sneathiella sp.]
MKFLYSFLLIIVSQINLANAQNYEKIEVACGVFPPFKMDSKYTPGVDLEVISAALGAVGKVVNYSFYPYKRAYAFVKSGQIAALCGCSYRPEREKYFEFSDLVGTLSQGIFLKNSYAGPPIRTLQDLQKLSVATMRGYALQRELANLEIKNLGVLNDHQLLQMLLNKRIDAIYAYRGVIRYEQKKMNNNELLTYFEISSQPNYVCISKAAQNSKKLQTTLARAYGSSGKMVSTSKFGINISPIISFFSSNRNLF